MHEQFTATHEAMIADGYEARSPLRRERPRALIDGSLIDAEVVNASQCESCGIHGLAYYPYYRTDCDSYRAFAVCERCGHSQEF
jgi:hypothetical protein